MSDYQRLISYMYTYEGGIKGKNIGFAKLEERNGRCKIMVSVKKIFAGGNPMGVFLLSGDKELRIGTLFSRNGTGEFRTVISSSDVDGAGTGLGEVYGLSIHDIESAWRSYTTVWEDAVAHAAEIELAEVTAENAAKKHPAEILSIAGEIEEELKIEKEREKDKKTETFCLGTLKEALEEDAGEVLKIEEEPKIEREWEKDKETENSENRIMENQRFTELKVQKAGRPESESKDSEPEKPEKQEPESENKNSESEEIGTWDLLRKRYPKILAFDYEDGCEILMIKPQDIGLLPRETWIYGNNSFLLHGYYHYRYLILAKLNEKGGKAGYLLGVPGHYYQNEKYMAAMFGFPDFVLAKKQETKNGRFGYWYARLSFDT